MYRLIPTQFHSFLSPCGQKCETLDAKWRNGKKDETEQKTTVKESGRYIKKCQQRREREKEREKEWMALYMCFVSFCAFLLGCVKWLGICLVSHLVVFALIGFCPVLWLVSYQWSVVSYAFCFAFGFTTCCHGHGVTSWWCDRQCKESACQSVNVGLMMCFCLFHPLVYNSMLVSALFIDTV